MKIVEVTWRDITYKEHGWNHLNDVDNFIKDSNENTIVQIGYLYRKTEDMIVLVDSYCEDKNTFGTIHKIPMGCVLRIRSISASK